MYSLMMIILDYLQYWNVCFVKATGLTLLNFIHSREAVLYFGIHNFLQVPEKTCYKTDFNFCLLIYQYLCTNMSLKIEIPDLLGSGRLVFCKYTAIYEMQPCLVIKLSTKPIAWKKR